MGDTAGAILTQEELPAVGIWLMPDNIAKGSLEHFVNAIRKSGDNLWSRADRVVEEIPTQERLFGTTQATVMKAKVHTWLAWQERPGLPYGSALRETYLDKDAPPALLLADWLRRLFSS